MRSRLALLVSAAVLASGCAGPGRPLDLGFKEVPSDVVLGAQTSPSPVVVPTSGPVPVVLVPPPSVVSLPPPPYQLPSQTGSTPPPPPLPTPVACPAGDPLAAPRVEAPSSISKPPIQAAYLFDNDGSFAVSGADARRGSFPARTLRIFNHIQKQSAGTFSYDVSELIGDTTTTTTYTVVTDAALPGEANALFLTKMVYRRTDGTKASFTPTPQLELAALPLLRGATMDQRAVDPQTQTAMSFTSTIEGKARVFACGEPLDTWTLHLTKGTLVSPSQNLQFDSTYQLGTQFGGIVVSDVVAFQGTDGSAGVQRSNRATIASAPRLP